MMGQKLTTPGQLMFPMSTIPHVLPKKQRAGPNRVLNLVCCVPAAGGLGFGQLQRATDDQRETQHQTANSLVGDRGLPEWLAPTKAQSNSETEGSSPLWKAVQPLAWQSWFLQPPSKNQQNQTKHQHMPTTVKTNHPVSLCLGCSFFSTSNQKKKRANRNLSKCQPKKHKGLEPSQFSQKALRSSFSRMPKPDKS